MNILSKIRECFCGKKSTKPTRYKPNSPLQDALRFRYILHLEKNNCFLQLVQLLSVLENDIHLRDYIDDLLDHMKNEDFETFRHLVSDIDGNYTIYKPNKDLEKDSYNEEAMLSILLHNGYLFCNNGFFPSDDDDEDKKFDKTICLFVLCNDLFSYASADAENIEADQIPELFKMYLKDPKWGVDKWSCIHRNLQPIRPIVNRMKEDDSWDEVMENLPKNLS